MATRRRSRASKQYPDAIPGSRAQRLFGPIRFSKQVWLDDKGGEHKNRKAARRASKPDYRPTIKREHQIA